MRRQKPEEAFQQQVLDLAKLCGFKRAHFRTVRIQRANGEFYYATPVQADGADFPDLLLLNGPVFLVWELKIPPKVATPGQLAWLAAFAAVGAEARVITPADWPYVESRLMGKPTKEQP